MILLLGGTSDTRPIAMRLAESGYRVLVSQATDVPLATGTHPNIESRSGPLDEPALAELVVHRGIRAIVNAAHPYAAAIHAAASRVAEEKNIRYFRFVRRPAIDVATPGVEFAPIMRPPRRPHFDVAGPVLLTTGTRNLAPYVEQSRHTGLPLFVRVLDQPASFEACLLCRHPAGIRSCRPRAVFAARQSAAYPRCRSRRACDER